MTIDLLLLAKSKKYNGYCIAGIDMATGEWVRVAKHGEHSFPKRDFRYSNGREPELLECVRFEVVGKGDTELHPEDVFVNTRLIKRMEQPDISVLRERVEQDYELHKFVYSNNYPKLLGNRLPGDIKNDPYSLMVIEPEEMSVYFQGEKLLADFSWKGTQYKKFRVTDIDLKKQMEDGDLNQLSFSNVYVVISLGEEYRREGSVTEEYYKLVSAVIDKGDDGDVGEDTTNEPTNENSYEKAKLIIRSLAEGRDPRTNETIRDISIFNQPDVIRALFYASEALEKATENTTSIQTNTPQQSTKRGRKRNFCLTDEEKRKVEIADIYIPISQITKNINAALSSNRVKKLSYKSILSWLVEQGYIAEEETKEQVIRRPTEKGAKEGIRLDRKLSETKGYYYITYYSPTMQRIIVDHVNEF